jgi:beta-xylosidase
VRRHGTVASNLGAGVLAVIVGSALVGRAAFADERAAAGTYRNPLDVVAADPFVYREGDTYYLYATAAADGLLVWTSNDLVHWRRRGHAFTRDATTWAQDRFWAPELLRHGGRYYLYFTAAHGPDREKDTPRTVLAEGASPLGPFREVAGKAPWFATDNATIDAHVFRDDDGRLYLYVVHQDQPPDKHYEIHVRKVDPGLNVSAESTEVLRSSQPWELVKHPFPNDARVTEAPFVVRRGATYFLTWSANPQGTAEYGVGVATAASPTGPFKKAQDNPILRRTDRLSAPGHQCLIDSPDGKRWFMLYHVRDPKDLAADRRIAIDRVHFKDGDVPALEVQGPTDSPQPLPLDPD